MSPRENLISIDFPVQKVHLGWIWLDQALAMTICYHFILRYESWLQELWSWKRKVGNGKTVVGRRRWKKGQSSGGKGWENHSSKRRGEIIAEKQLKITFQSERTRFQLNGKFQWVSIISFCFLLYLMSILILDENWLGLGKICREELFAWIFLCPQILTSSFDSSSR